MKCISKNLSIFDDFDIKVLKKCKRAIKKDPISKRTYLGRKKRSYPYPNKSQIF